MCNCQTIYRAQKPHREPPASLLGEILSKGAPTRGTMSPVRSTIPACLHVNHRSFATKSQKHVERPVPPAGSLRNHGLWIYPGLISLRVLFLCADSRCLCAICARGCARSCARGCAQGCARTCARGCARTCVQDSINFGATVRMRCTNCI